MDRDDVIVHLSRATRRMIDGWIYKLVRPDVAKKAVELLQEQPQWIPVSEKKPRSMANKVIVYLQHDDYVPQIGYGHYEKYQGEEMWYNLENDEQFSKRGYTVTHWMPMPRSPEGEELALS